MENVFFRTAFNYDRDAVSDETGLFCEDESLAVQSSADECDINTIVRRFGLTGELPSHVAVPSYGDFTGVVDYHSALNLVIAADAAFMTLPADVRSRFHNNPEGFLKFVEDPANRPELDKMGLTVRPYVPPKVEVVAPQQPPIASQPLAA